MQLIIGGYIRGQVALCFVVSVLVGAGLAVLGMPYAVLLGVFSFVAEFIPVLGTIVTGVVAVLLALTQGWLMAVLVLAYFIVVHVLEGYLLAPRLVGKSVGIHPVISLLAFTIGAELFGLWGAIFASPAAGLIQALVGVAWSSYEKANREAFLSESGEQPAQTKNPTEALNGLPRDAMITRE